MEKTLDLKKSSVTELDNEELREINGGLEITYGTDSRGYYQLTRYPDGRRIKVYLSLIA